MAKAAISIISTLRPHRVQPMLEHLEGLPHVWLVARGEASDYRYAGAKHVVEAGRLSETRNLAMEVAFRNGLPAVQISDDMTGIHKTTERDAEGKRSNKIRIRLADAIDEMLDVTASVGARLGGVSPTDNPFFAASADVSTSAFIIGDLSCYFDTDLRCRTDLPLKEDLELTLQHLKKYGKVARLNTILPGFMHRDNLGGAVQIRTAEREQAAIRRIQELHPGCTIMNSRRANEILLRWPPADTADTAALQEGE